MSNSSSLEIYNRDIAECKVMVVPTGQAATIAVATVMGGIGGEGVDIS